MINDPVLVNDWHVIAACIDLNDSRETGVRLLGEQLLVTQSADEVNVQRTPGSGGETVRCRTRQRYGLIWVTFGEPSHDVPAYCEWDEPSYWHVLGGPYHIHASAPRFIENFLDISHLPFVHEGILGSKDHVEINDYKVRSCSDGIVATDLHTWTPDPDGSGEPKLAHWTYRVLRPLTAYIRLTTGDGSELYTMFFTVSPTTSTESVGWMWNSMNYNHDMADADFAAYIDEIVMQDIPIVESQRPKLLPLDLTAELHVRADKLSVAYRRWLKRLGVRFGTA